MNSKAYVLLLASYCFCINQSMAQQNNSSSNDKTPIDGLSVQKKRWAVKLGIGAAVPSHYGGLWTQQTAPVLFIQPEYKLAKQLNLGFRFEYAFLTKYRATYMNNELDYGIVKASSMPSIALLLDYHFQDESQSFSPFIGIGIGEFFRGQGELISMPNPLTVNLGNAPGLIPRVGFANKRISIFGEGNILWENKTDGTFRAWWGNSGEFRGRSYATIKLSYSL